jgi:hypothetical protein
MESLNARELSEVSRLVEYLEESAMRHVSVLKAELQNSDGEPIGVISRGPGGTYQYDRLGMLFYPGHDGPDTEIVLVPREDDDE